MAAAEVIAVAGVSVVVEDGDGEIHARPVDIRFGVEGVAAAVLVGEDDLVPPPVLLLDGHFQLQLALFLLVFHDRPLRPMPARAVVVDVDVFLFDLRVVVLLLALLFHADIGGAFLVQVGGELRLAFRLILFALRLAPPRHGVRDPVFGDEHAVDRVIFLLFVPVRVAAEHRHVIIEVAADAVAEQVGVIDGGVIGIGGKFALGGGRLVLDRPVAEQLFDQRHIPVDGIGDLRLLFGQAAVGARGRGEQGVCLRGGCGYAAKRRRAAKYRRVPGRRRGVARVAGGEDGPDRSRAVGVEVVRILDLQKLAPARQGIRAQEHGQQDAEQEGGGEQRRAQRDPNLLPAERGGAAVRIGGLAFGRLRIAEFPADVFSDAVVGEHGGRLIGQQFFQFFHSLPSFSRYFFNFFRASLFFQVTVPMGISSMAATSRRL